MSYGSNFIVAERISHFCLAHNLIWPLGLTYNFTQSGWLIQFNPDHLSGSTNWGNLPNTFFLQNFCSVQTSHCLLFNSSSSSSITPPWGKQSNLWTPCVYSLRPKVPSWIWIRKIQYATHRSNFMSPPKLAMSTTMQNSAPTPSNFTSWQYFLETFTLPPKQPEPQTHGDYNHFCPQTANMTFATLWRTYFPHTLNNALT